MGRSGAVNRWGVKVVIAIGLAGGGWAAVEAADSRETQDAVVYRLDADGGSGAPAEVADFIAKELGQRWAETSVGPGWARHAIKLGGFVVAFIDGAQLVGPPTRAELVVCSDRECGSTVTLDHGERLGVALFYDSGQEMKWVGGFSLELSIDPKRPEGLNLAGATPMKPVGIAQFPLLGSREAADSVFDESFGNGGRFLILRKDSIRGIQPGNYLLMVPELPGASANILVRP